MTTATAAPADEPNPLLRAALAYSARGWKVFPVEARGKRPLGRLVRHGLKEATTDEATIRNWWRREPRANVGVVTGAASGVDVVDLDVKGDGRRTLADFEEDHGRIETLTAETPSGGQHLYLV